MRELDRLTTERFLIPQLLLMETAAQSSLQSIVRHYDCKTKILSAAIFCGPGNNGGDGAALARQMYLAGARVNVFLFTEIEGTKGDARTNFEILRQLGNAAEKESGHLTLRICTDENELPELLAARHETLWIDALFGTGLKRPLAGIYKSLVAAINSRQKTNKATPFVVALDLPSGLDADQAGAVGEAIRADMTITCTAPKPANVLAPAAELNGRLEIVRIGTPEILINESPSQLFMTEENDARRWLETTRYTHDSYKNTHGHAFVIAGSRDYTGAAVLCANAAMRSGVGLTTLCTPASALPLIAPRLMPEVISHSLAETASGAVAEKAFDDLSKLLEKASVIAIGPGLSSNEETTVAFVKRIVETRKVPVVIDADGLNALSPWPPDLRGSVEAPIIITPHLGEMRRLLGSADDAALADRVAAVRSFATDHHIITVLKGARVLIGCPDGDVLINPTGNPGTGTGGSGDTLTGIITGFLAQAAHRTNDYVCAVATAIYTSGIACDLAAKQDGMRAMVASDIREHLPAAILRLDAAGEMP